MKNEAIGPGHRPIFYIGDNYTISWLTKIEVLRTQICAG